MADYKGIKGFKVQSLASDPSGPEGQVWYNTTGNVLKYQALAGSWSSGGTFPGLGVQEYPGSAGTVTAALCFAGLTTSPGGGTYTKESYEYNGTAWSSETDMNRSPGAYTQGLGTQTAALSGGYYRTSPAGTLTDSEEYNGAAWTTTNPTQNAIGIRTGCGTSTAGLEAGGSDVTPSAPVGTCEDYNGTSWANVASLNTPRDACATHNGTLTAAFTIGGRTPSLVDQVEEFNGTGWSETTDINTPKDGIMGSGTTALALIYGGQVPAVTNEAESWDGTTWTQVDTLATARAKGGGAGTTNVGGLCICGGQPGYGTNVEEFSVGNTVKTVTVS